MGHKATRKGSRNGLLRRAKSVQAKRSSHAKTKAYISKNKKGFADKVMPEVRSNKKMNQISEKKWLETDRKIKENLDATIRKILQDDFKKLPLETQKRHNLGYIQVSASEEALLQISAAWKEFYRALDELLAKQVVKDDQE